MCAKVACKLLRETAELNHLLCEVLSFSRPTPILRRSFKGLGFHTLLASLVDLRAREMAFSLGSSQKERSLLEIHKLTVRFLNDNAERRTRKSQYYQFPFWISEVWKLS